MRNEADFWWAQLRGPGDSGLPPSVLQRIGWYERQVRLHRIGFYASEVLVLVLSASIPASAAAGAGVGVAGVLGALVVAATGLRQIFRWSENWIRSSRSLVALQGEVVSWSCGAAPYDDQAGAAAVLAARAEAMARSETGDWAGMLRDRAAAAESTGVRLPAPTEL